MEATVAGARPRCVRTRAAMPANWLIQGCRRQAGQYDPEYSVMYGYFLHSPSKFHEVSRPLREGSVA